MAMNHSQKKRLENVWEALKHDKIAIFSIIFLALILILSLLAPVLPLEPNKTDVVHMLEAPSSAHIFGTDEVGRDYLARVIYGGRVSLLVGVLAMLMSVTIGVTVGILAGYLGGIVDGILMRIVDILQSIPWLILVTVISIFFKQGLVDGNRPSGACGGHVRQREGIRPLCGLYRCAVIKNGTPSSDSFGTADDHHRSDNQYLQCDHDRVIPEFLGDRYSGTAVFLGKTVTECTE